MTRPTAVWQLPSQEPDQDAKEPLGEAASTLPQGLEELRLAEEVGRALRATGYPPLWLIEISVSGRQVSLRGRVPSYYLKQIAQAVVLALPGIVELRNDLEVVRPR
jgi:hypothetical protein